MRFFWRLTLAKAASEAGNSFLYVAVPWALMQITGSGFLAVLSMAAQTTPYLLSPFLGALIDRHDRRIAFAVAEMVQFAAVAALPLLLAWHQVGMVYAALFVVGLGKAVSDATSHYGLIPALVPQERLQQASGWFNAVLLLARLTGPALAGLTVAALGPSWALGIDAVTFLGTVLAALTLPALGASGRADGGVPLLALMREGFAYFRSRRDLRWLSAVMALYNLGVGGLEPTLLTLGTLHWKWSSASLGLVLSGGAAAAAVGAWMSSRRTADDEDVRRRIGAWMAVTALGSVALLFAPPWAVAGGFVVLCLGEGGFNSTTMAFRQREIPPELSGRINTIIRTFIIGAIPVSSFLLGMTLSQSLPVPVLLPVTVGALGAAALWGLTVMRQGPGAPAVTRTAAPPAAPAADRLSKERLV